MSSLSAHRTGVAIVGSGIVGLCCAHYLQQQGEQVTLIDAKGPGSETSFGNAGSISVGNLLPQSTPGITMKALAMLINPLAPLKLDWSRLPSYAEWLFQFVRYGRAKQILPIIDALHAINSATRDCWLTLADQIGAGALLDASGYLHVYSEEASFAAGGWERDLMRERGVRFDVLDRQQLLDLEPQLGDGFEHAVFQRDSLAMRDPGAFCLQLATNLAQRGVQSMQAKVSVINKVGTGYQLMTDRGSVLAERVLIAAGAWSNRLLKPFGVQLPVIPARGYHLMFAPQAHVVHRPTLWAERYMVISPMQQGIRMTSIKELTALDSEPHYQWIRRLQAEAKKLFPTLSDEPIAEWSGNRPCTPDSLPILDQLPDEQIYLACGHGHLGLTQAPISGKLMAQRMYGEPTSISLAPYRWNRF